MPESVANQIPWALALAIIVTAAVAKFDLQLPVDRNINRLAKLAEAQQNIDDPKAQREIATVIRRLNSRILRGIPANDPSFERFLVFAVAAFAGIGAGVVGLSTTELLPRAYLLILATVCFVVSASAALFLVIDLVQAVRRWAKKKRDAMPSRRDTIPEHD